MPEASPPHSPRQSSTASPSHTPAQSYTPLAQSTDSADVNATGNSHNPE